MNRAHGFAILLLGAGAVWGQAPPPATPQARAERPPAAEVAGIPVNYDETKVGTYKLPDPLLLANGKPVRDAKTWNAQRRPEIVKLFEENEYGRAPGRPAGLHFVVNESGPAFDGKGVRK